MTTQQQIRDRRRFRLATNDNEIVVDDDLDTEGHRLATNDNETTVERARADEPADADETAGLGPTGLSNH